VSSHWKRTESFHEAKAERWAAEDEDREKIVVALEVLAAGGGTEFIEADDLLRIADLVRKGLI